MFIFKVVIKWVVLSAAVMLAAHLIPGMGAIGWTLALWVGLVLGLINTFVKPVLTILSIPVNILTLGLFSFVLNAFLFWIAIYAVTSVGPTYVAALLGSIVVAIVMWIAHFFID